MSATRWTGLYDESWHDLIVPEAFSHPAKMARGLIHRIYRHLIDQGYVRAGEHILDPFGGVACGALDAMTYGLSWTGCELETRFVALGNQNLALWRQRFGFTTGQLLQGDSRQLGTVLAGQGQALVTSPPYAESLQGQEQTIDPARVRRLHDAGYTAKRSHGFLRSQHSTSQSGDYGSTPGQLGAMPAGALVTSPPYAESLTGGEDESAKRRERLIAQGYGKGNRSFADGIVHGKAGGWTASAVDGYGTTPGNLGNLPAGALVTSPPFMETLQASAGIDKEARRAAATRLGKPQEQITPADLSSPAQTSYGTTPGNLGNDQPDTFWSAATAILTACWPLLQPGAICAFVLKNYIRKKQIVPFCEQWRACCEAVGYRFVEEIWAMQVEEHGTQRDLFGSEITLQTRHASFFRKLAEKKGSPVIDHEVVLLMRRP